jgi:hypothetical protein
MHANIVMQWNLYSSFLKGPCAETDNCRLALNVSVTLDNKNDNKDEDDDDGNNYNSIYSTQAY